MHLQPAPLFQNHCVLQRGRPIPVWGQTAPLTVVEVSFGQAHVRGISNARGEFLLRLPPQDPGAPRTLRFSLPATGEGLDYSDVVVGEVWLASGQSNMEWTMGHLDEAGAGDVRDTALPDLRFFTVGKRAHLGPQSDAQGAWLPATPTHNPGHSAVAFYFARNLHRALNVPVGIIVAAWGGTLIEAWAPRSVLADFPPLETWLNDADTHSQQPERWPTDRPLIPAPPALVNLPSLPPLDPGYAAPGLDVSGWPRMELPATWQRRGHPFSGVFWFRKTLTLPPHWIGKDLLLGLGAADKQDVTFVNGVEIGRTGEGYEDRHWNRTRHYSIPSALTAGGTLDVSVRVFSFLYDGGLIGPAEAMKLTLPESPDAPLSLAGDWAYRVEHNYGQIITQTQPGHGQHNSPHILFDNMIRPLLPFALRGALWYQGESNADRPEQYVHLLGGMIRAWRTHFEQADFPFLVVQLPAWQEARAFDEHSNWARLREAQVQVATSVPNAHLTVNLDLGDASDIHPLRKEPVGARLATVALAEVYRQGSPGGGPLPCDFRLLDDTVTVCFRRCEGGLQTLDGKPVQTLHLAGEDGVFLPAEGFLRNDCLDVRRAGLTSPRAIAYAWSDNPQGANLGDAQGVPASPFRHWF